MDGKGRGRKRKDREKVREGREEVGRARITNFEGHSISRPQQKGT